MKIKLKKVTLSLFVVMLLLAMVGCGNKAEENVSDMENITENIALDNEVVALGESKDSGDWNLTVNTVEELMEIEGYDEDEVVKATGKFVVVLLDMKNISSEPKSYSFYDFDLLDESTGKSYSVQDNAVEASINYVSEEKFYKENAAYVTINDRINPDDSKLGAIVFDVNTELDLKNLVIVSENDGSDVPIKFGLSK